MAWGEAQRRHRRCPGLTCQYELVDCRWSCARNQCVGSFKSCVSPSCKVKETVVTVVFQQLRTCSISMRAVARREGGRFRRVLELILAAGFVHGTVGCELLQDAFDDLRGGGRPAEERAAESFSRGETYLARGDLDAAESAFRQAISDYSQFGEASLMLAKVYHLRGEDARALLELGSAERLLPESGDLHSLRGRIHFGQGRYGRAAQYYKKAVSIGRDPQDLQQLGLALARAGRVEDAREVMKELQESRTAHDTRMFEGLLKAAEGEAAAARDLLQQAAAKAGDPEPHAALGWFLMQQGEPREAREALNKAVELGGNIAVVRSYVEALIDAGEAEQARGMIEPYTVSRARDPLIHAAYARALVGLGRYEEALAAANNALRFDPRLAPALLARGAALEGAGDIDSAVESYRAASREAPGLSEAYRLLAGAYRAQGRTTDAINALERLIVHDPSDRRGAIALLELCKDNPAHARRGLRLANRLLEADPRDRRILRLRGELQSLARSHSPQRTPPPRPSRSKEAAEPEIIRGR